MDFNNSDNTSSFLSAFNLSAGSDGNFIRPAAHGIPATNKNIINNTNNHAQLGNGAHQNLSGAMLASYHNASQEQNEQQQQHQQHQLGQHHQHQQQLHQLQQQLQFQQQQAQQFQPRAFQQHHLQQQQQSHLHQLHHHFQQLQQSQPQHVAQLPSHFQQLQAAQAQPHAMQLQLLQQQHVSMLQQLHQQAQLQQQQQQHLIPGVQPQAILNPNTPMPGAFDPQSMNLTNKMTANGDFFQQYQQKKKLNPEMEGMLSDESEGLDALINSFGDNIPQGLTAANGHDPALNPKSPPAVAGLSKPILINGLNHANVNAPNPAAGAIATNPSQYMLQANARKQMAMGMPKPLSENSAVPVQAYDTMPPGYANMLNANGAVNMGKQLFENPNTARFGVVDNMKKPPGVGMSPYSNNDLDLNNKQLLQDIANFATPVANIIRNNPITHGKKSLKGNKKKKLEGKPRRPLSAYNLFFKEERAKMIKEPKMPKVATDHGDNEDDAGGQKIGFENMAKIIGKRWRELSEEKVAQFKKLADEDMKRYKAEMETFLGNFQSESEDLKNLKFYQDDPPQSMPPNPTEMKNHGAIAGMQFVPGDEGILPSGLLAEAVDNVSFDSSDKQFSPKKKRKNMMSEEEDPSTAFNNRDARPATKPRKGPAPKKKPVKSKKPLDPSEGTSVDPETKSEPPKKKRGRKKKVKSKPDAKSFSPAISEAPSSGLDVSDIYDTFVTQQPGNSLGDKTKVDTGAVPTMTDLNGKRKPDGMENWNTMLNAQQQQQQPQHAVMMQLLKNAAAASGNDVSAMYGMLGLNNNSNNLAGQTVNSFQVDQNRTDDMKGENQQQEQNMWHV